MGCSNSKAVESLNDKYVDTDDFKEEHFPHFQPNFYDKEIKNIKKVYEERINEGNNIIVKIHKIFIIINYTSKNTTNIRIEIEKKDGQIVKKHLTKITFDYVCSLDNLKTLLEVYNSKFNIHSNQWYQLKPSTDIYIKAEKINNDLIKIFEMFYEKNEKSLTFNKIIKWGNSDNSCEAICCKINPGEVVKKYNELKSIYYDNKPEIFYYSEHSEKIKKYYNDIINGKYVDFNSLNNNNNNNNNYNNNNNNYSNNYSNNNSNHNNSNHDNNESEDKKSNNSATMRDHCNRELGRVDRDGVVRDHCNRELGRFDRDGVVRDHCNRELGRFDRDGVIKDHCNRELGRIDSDGVVRDRCNYELGRIDSDGVVRDRSNREIGRAEGISKEQAAYMYFFNNME